MYFALHTKYTVPFVQKNQSVSAVWVNDVYVFLFSRKTADQYSAEFLNIGANIRVEATSYKLRYT
jgi:hypothetical protein